MLNPKQITGLKIVVIGDPDRSNLINARLSWRPVSMSLKKYIHYNLSWSSEDCKDESKPLRVRTPVSKLYLVGYYGYYYIINYYQIYSYLINLQHILHLPT